MKKLLFLLAIPLLAAGCASQQQSSSNPGDSGNAQAQGRAVFSITDASADLQNVTSVNLAVDKLEAHSAAEGWVVVSTQPKTFDLLKLKQSGMSQILADAQIAVGTYDQIRIHISGVTLVKSGVESQVKLPSNELKIVGKVVVGQNATASVVLDFLLDKSLHQTGNGSFILTPVIKVESKSGAQVQVKSDGSVEIKDGKEEENETVGTDENGEVKANFEFDDNEKLEVTDNDVIHVKSDSQSETAVKITAQRAVEISLQSGKLDAAISVKLETQDGKKVWRVTGILGLVATSVFVDAATGSIVMVQ